MQQDNEKVVVALLAGGYSLERDVAIRSGKHIASLFEGDKRYLTYLIQVSQDGWYLEDAKGDGHRFEVDRNDFSLTLLNKEKIKFDLAVILLGGSPGEDGQLQGYLQINKVPFVGCGLLASGMFGTRNF